MDGCMMGYYGACTTVTWWVSIWPLGACPDSIRWHIFTALGYNGSWLYFNQIYCHFLHRAWLSQLRFAICSFFGGLLRRETDVHWNPEYLLENWRWREVGPNVVVLEIFFPLTFDGKCGAKLSKALLRMAGIFHFASLLWSFMCPPPEDEEEAEE